ncbi:hypothetical protein D3C72_1667480 [compost metagenome]
MMLLAWSASVMAPTAMVEMPTSLRMRSANGVWYMRPYTGLAARVVWPDDTSMKSAPASLKRRATTTASASVLPPGAQSCAEMRTLMGLSAGHTARIARNTSSG